MNRPKLTQEKKEVSNSAINNLWSVVPLEDQRGAFSARSVILDANFFNKVPLAFVQRPEIRYGVKTEDYDLNLPKRTSS
jgi:hypothetical protein